MDRTGTPLLEALGMSEVSTYISGAPDKAHQPGTIGRPQRGRRIAILAENAADPVPHGSSGRLAVSRRDPGLMLGYWNDAPATDAAMTGEWFVTGDRAALSSDGTLTYHGRSDDLMTAQGYRIAPQEIETHLLKHADVNEVAVCSVARGEIRLVTAFVVPNADVSDGALLAHCVAGLADYKVPKQIIRVEALPRNANGKLIRRALPSLLE
jgi:acyl-coenzyme A synthetase/AMP-(fatty) acid ligase